MQKREHELNEVLKRVKKQGLVEAVFVFWMVLGSALYSLLFYYSFPHVKQYITVRFGNFPFGFAICYAHAVDILQIKMFLFHQSR